MAFSYTLIGSRPMIQVTSQTTRREVQVCTIRTAPSGVTADLWVDRATFDAGASGPELTAFANNIEAIIAKGKAIGGTGSTTLDDNGLQQTAVTFTVGYSPKGVQAGQITTDVGVPVALLSVGDTGLSATATSQAEAMVDAAYNNLVAAAGGTPDQQPPEGALPPPTRQAAQ